MPRFARRRFCVPGIIEVSGLVKVYETGDLRVEALRGVDLEIEESPVDAYLGDNPQTAPFLAHRIYDLSKLKSSGAHVPDTSLEKGLRQHLSSLTT